MRSLVAALLLWLSLDQAAAGQVGLGSWYYEGRHTANGERFDPDGVTCAHRDRTFAPFNSRLRITDIRTGRSVVCRVNDWGPATWTGCIVDLSRGAARLLGQGFIDRGRSSVRVERVS